MSESTTEWDEQTASRYTRSICHLELNVTCRKGGLAYGVKTNDHMLSRFHLIPERYGRTDRQICYISIALMRDKNSRVRVREFTYFQANSATVLPSCEWKHVAAYYFLRTINCRVDLRRLYAKVNEMWH